ncbi:flavin reductase [Amorphus sp. 3PC139-8]|uniref:flavin reductase n=1 Tax=Amorphus sp. 3PC139-8 TaxID=2735676 RepID=UPI00345D3D1C
MTILDTNEFRQALGCFLTGVTIVTTCTKEGIQRGFTANSFTSVSLDPPLILVCLGKSASSFPVFSETEHFAVNILGEKQSDVSGAFASKAVDKFAHGDWRTATTGSPILSDAAAWLDCRLHDRVDAGDHVILIGRVVDFAHSPQTPLGYHSGNYVTFAPGEQAVDKADDEKRVVAGLFEKEGRLLLIRDGDMWRLPRASLLGKSGREKGTLLGMLADIGVDATINFLYTVAEDPKYNVIHVCFRGKIENGPTMGHPDARLFAFSDIPWAALPTHPEERHIIARYFNERIQDQFGLYVGTLTEGEVKKIPA